MNTRVLIAAALAVLSGWLLWQGLSAVIMITGRGSPLGDALLQPPTSLIRVLGTSLALIGGILAAAQRKGGAAVAAIGAALFALLPILMAASGADSGLWTDEAVFSALMIAFTIGLFMIKRGKA
jgi:hypothetical protein